MKFSSYFKSTYSSIILIQEFKYTLQMNYKKNMPCKKKWHFQKRSWLKAVTKLHYYSRLNLHTILFKKTKKNNHTTLSPLNYFSNLILLLQ